MREGDKEEMGFGVALITDRSQHRHSAAVTPKRGLWLCAAVERRVKDQRAVNKSEAA